ncbi:MAG: 30S ribosomal protein S8 [bacterium JZ-2024 1]
MAVNDPVSDMLIRIQNAARASLPTCTAVYSRLNHSIANLLVREGYIQDVEVVGPENKKSLLIHLKYVVHGGKKIPPFEKFEIMSKPGRRLYCSWKNVPRVMGGLGIVVLSTSRGILTDREARRQRQGGQLLFKVR